MNSLIERLGWTLLHSLWQGALIWVLVEITLVTLRSAAARTRYAVACAALGLFALAPVVTFLRLDLPARLHTNEYLGASFAKNSPAGDSATASLLPPAPAVGSAYPSRPLFAARLRPFLPWLVYAWLCGSMWSCARLTVGWRISRRISISGLQPLPAEIEDLFRSVRMRLGIDRAVRIGRSAAVQVPTVIGWWRPVILWPAGIAAGISPAQIEALLAHELAHIARHDFAVNLLQAVSEALFFYHPAAHAINRHIRREREHACDDVAVALTHDSLGYAQALAALEITRAPVPLAVAASGDGQLLTRVRRLLRVSAAPPREAVSFALPALVAAGAYLILLLAAPVLTAQVLTARERIAQIQATAPDNLVVYQPGEKMRFSGELHAPDGSLLDVDATLSGSARTNNTTYGMAFTARHGTFAKEIEAGEFSLGGWVRGFAPFIVGPFHPDPKTRTISPILVTLTRGFPTQLVVSDETGQPLPGVKLMGWITEGVAAPSKTYGTWTTDEHGIVSLENVDDRTVIDLLSAKPGFQDDHKTFDRFAPDAPLTWTLRRAVPTTNQVVDASTGAPLPGVKVQLASRESGNFASNPDRDDNILAITDATGRFTLDTLNPAWNYRVFLKSPDHALVTETVASGTSKVFRLQRGLSVAGTVQGLPPGDATLRCRIDVPIDSTMRTISQRTLVLKGDENTRAFAFEHVPPGSVTLSVNEHSLEINLHADETAVRFDTSPHATSHRQVKIHFRTPGSEVPAGALVATLSAVEQHGPPSPRRLIVPLQAGSAEFEVISPSKVELVPARLLGFWFAPQTIEVPDVPGQLEVTLDATPAGAIHGRWLEPDGSIVREAFISCLVIDPPKTMGRSPLGLEAATDGPARDAVFTLTPLPFEGTYALLLHHDLNFTQSRPIAVTADMPLTNVELRRKPGVDLEVRVVNATGAPIPGVPLSLEYLPGESTSFSTLAGTTDGVGRFTLHDINFDVPGRYKIIARIDEWHSRGVPLTPSTPRPVMITIDHAP
jgi:beta-lactamase regulating signal transducer with metallopeptidase domain